MEKTRKRKAPLFFMNELNEDLLEKVLSWLPPASFFCLRSVCRRWGSVVSSPSFLLACSQIPFRAPWFLMVDENLDHSIFFDSSEWNWKSLNRPCSLNQASYIPIASAGGLLCFRSASGELMAWNPVTGAGRQLPPSGETQALQALAMSSSAKDPSSYRITLISGSPPNLSFRTFHSEKNLWEDEVTLASKPETDTVSGGAGGAVYFLNKSGDVVAANMQRNPSKQFSSVVTTDDGDELVYFLSPSGAVVACNLTSRSFLELPRLMPFGSEYSVDVVASRGEMLVVLLSEFFGTASLRMWRFAKEERLWRQAAAMPPAMSHEFFGKKIDINCVGCGDLIFICLNSSEFSSSVVCNVVANEWIELPQCVVKGKAKEFISAFSFEPRLELSL
ncbi:F-box only protein 13 [Apostasia shenzhenica]|uniref:F-box only protein 13 n=1 Tax=Apostasia shenzhenica TaxID=1088818 RepID=A0A2I0B898_9ASPA|nr:F-box only protein 13 [Apostasia shenzhenica]